MRTRIGFESDLATALEELLAALDKTPMRIQHWQEHIQEPENRAKGILAEVKKRVILT